MKLAIILFLVLFCFCTYVNYEEKCFKLKVKIKKALHMKYNPRKYSYEKIFNKNKFIAEYTFKWKDIIMVLCTPSYLSSDPSKPGAFKKYIYNTFSMIAEDDEKLFLEMEYTWDYILRHLQYIHENYDAFKFCNECERLYNEIVKDIKDKFENKLSEIDAKGTDAKEKNYNNYIKEYNKNLDLLKEFWNKTL